MKIKRIITHVTDFLNPPKIEGVVQPAPVAPPPTPDQKTVVAPCGACGQKRTP